MATVSEALAAAIKHHQAGRRQAAEQIYRQILEIDPRQPDATHLLGVIAFETRSLHELAIEHIQRAIRLTGTVSAFHNTLGEVYRAAGKLTEAVACYRRALKLQRDYAEAHSNLGCALQDQGKLDEAVVSLRQAVRSKPRYAEAHNNLGNAFMQQGKLKEAIASYCRALESKPDYAKAHFNLGTRRVQAPREDCGSGRLKLSTAERLEFKPELVRSTQQPG